jgi:penicillin-binding protein 1A
VITLAGATAASDNSVFAELGVNVVGTNKIARVAHAMGVKTALSRNLAMTLGGLKEGVTPLEMAYAYSTLANNGERVYGTMSPNGSTRSPVAIEKVLNPDGSTRDVNHVRHVKVIPYNVAQTAKSILAGVITGGTGKAAQIGEFAAGKTGTTENYGDAWFVGFNKDLTVAVWVGYPDKLRPMLTEYHGSPVAGGTFPAEIWHDFMTSWIKLRDTRKAVREGKDPSEVTTPTTTPTTTPAQTAPAQTQSTPAQTPAATPKAKQPTPTQQAPEQTQPTQQQPPAQQQPAPTQGDGGGGTTPPPTGTTPPATGTG